MQTLLIWALAAPLVILVVLNLVGPIVSAWDWLRHPTPLKRH